MPEERDPDGYQADEEESGVVVPVSLAANDDADDDDGTDEHDYYSSSRSRPALKPCFYYSGIPHRRKRKRHDDDKTEKSSCSCEHRKRRRRPKPPLPPPPTDTSLLRLSHLIHTHWDAVSGVSRPYDSHVADPAKNDGKHQTPAILKRNNKPKPCDYSEVMPPPFSHHHHHGKTFLIMMQRHFTMEEALSLSKNPRVMLESQQPYRVCHSNAAYLKLQSSCTTEKEIYSTTTTTSGDSCCSPCPSSLTQAISECSVVGNHTPPLSVFPVHGSERPQGARQPMVTHYLIEMAASGIRSDDPSSTYEEASRAVG